MVRQPTTTAQGSPIPGQLAVVQGLQVPAELSATQDEVVFPEDRLGPRLTEFLNVRLSRKNPAPVAPPMANALPVNGPTAHVMHNAGAYQAWLRSNPSERWYGYGEKVKQDDDMARPTGFLTTKLIREYTNAFLSVSVDRVRSPGFLGKLQELTHKEFTPYTRGNLLYRHRRIFFMALFETCVHLVAQVPVDLRTLTPAERVYAARELFGLLVQHEGEVLPSDQYNILLLEGCLSYAALTHTTRFRGPVGVPTSPFTYIARFLYAAVGWGRRPFMAGPDAASSQAITEAWWGLLADVQRRLHAFMYAFGLWLEEHYARGTSASYRTTRRKLDETFAELYQNILVFYDTMHTWFRKSQHISFFRSHLAVKLFLLIFGIGVLYMTAKAIPQVCSTISSLAELLNEWLFTWTPWSTPAATPAAPYTWQTFYEALGQLFFSEEGTLNLLYKVGEIFVTLVLESAERILVREATKSLLDQPFGGLPDFVGLSSPLQELVHDFLKGSPEREEVNVGATVADLIVAGYGAEFLMRAMMHSSTEDAVSSVASSARSSMVEASLPEEVPDEVADVARPRHRIFFRALFPMVASVVAVMLKLKDVSH